MRNGMRTLMGQKERARERDRRRYIYKYACKKMYFAQLFPLILISSRAAKPVSIFKHWFTHPNQKILCCHRCRWRWLFFIFSLLYRALSLTLIPISFSIPFQILRRIILFYSQKKRIYSSSSSLLLLLLFFHSALVMEFNKCQSDDREMNTKVTNLWITLKWQS